MLSNKIKEEARKFALKNAADYGKADEKAVLGRLLAANPRLRSDIRSLSELAKQAVQEVNKMSKADVDKEFGRHAEEFAEREKKKAAETAEPKMELEGAVSGSFATRFPPGPNGYMHIGHSKAVFLEREFANIYRGRLFLYFDDTNPEKDRQEYVDAFHNDLEWLGIKFDEEYYASDHIEQMYEYTRKLISLGKAYACACGREDIKEKRFKGVECKHRSQNRKENGGEFKKMLAGDYKEGEAIIRFLGDMKAENTALRDPTLLRIKRETHYRQGTKYIVWPTYDLNTAIVDSLHGVTDVIRSKEFELRDELGRRILEALDLKVPRIHSMSRLAVKDNVTHKRELRKLIDEGLLWGWDDPRLVTIAGLRRRGIQPEAIRRFALRSGMSKMDGALNIDMLLAENRNVIDDISRRLFLVQEPAELKITGMPRKFKSVKLNLHPSKSLGQRESCVSDKLLISGSDAKTLKRGSKFRLKDLFNVKIEKIGAKEIAAKFIGNESIDAQKFQWVDSERNVRCKLIRVGPLLRGGAFNKESITESAAYAEEYVNKLQREEIVQFERVGFFKLDSVKEKTFISI